MIFTQRQPFKFMMRSIQLLVNMEFGRTIANDLAPPHIYVPRRPPARKVHNSH
jgi:hypothetical protein